MQENRLSTTNKYWAIIPAAGSGTRLPADRPKQYLTIGGKTIIEHTLQKFCDCPNISAITVAIAEQDTYWSKLAIKNHQKITTTIGGSERCESVLNALKTIAAQAQDWILVHDAARPCLHTTDLDKLIKTLSDHPVGGLLALPVRDTLKRADADGLVTATVNRDNLWQAFTPQMFRFKMLKDSLQTVWQKGIIVTDEAQAIEYCGYRPKLIEGSPDNIKITCRHDLAIATNYLMQRS